MKYLIQLLKYKSHPRHRKGHAIIIKNILNVNIFVQHNFKNPLAKYNLGSLNISQLIQQVIKTLEALPKLC